MGEIIVPNNLDRFKWKFLRKGLGNLLEAAAPLASVHREWKLEFNPADSLGKVTPALKGKDSHAGFVHSWMIGLGQDVPITTDSGDDTYIGGSTSEYYLTFVVWGFFDYKGWRTTFDNGAVLVNQDFANPIADEPDNATDAAENESRAIKAYIRANPTLTLDLGGAVAQPFGFEDGSVHPFSGGDRILIVQGGVRVRVRESF